ncbi:MAG: RNA methyltransferase [Oscillospiraceae bacterium]|nr:RNA methyltransferase [Oscillospiraceae bacterium]
MIVKIDKDNNLVKSIKKLHLKKYRIEEKRFIVEGWKLVKEAIKSIFSIELIIISERALDEWDKSFVKESFQGNIYIAKDSVFNSMCKADTPQGILAVVSSKNFKFNIRTDVYVYLDSIQDPGNLGTIIRTSHAAGIKGIILSKGCVDILNDKVIRSSMGSIFHVPYFIDENYFYLKELKDKGFKIIAGSLSSQKDFYDIDFSGKIVMIFGNEGSGITEEVLNFVSEDYKIPMPGGAESLNVAVASGIIIYEVIKKRDN